MKAHIKKILVIAGVVLAMLAGLLLVRSSHKPTPSALAANPSPSFVPSGSGMSWPPMMSNPLSMTASTLSGSTPGSATR